MKPVRAVRVGVLSFLLAVVVDWGSNLALHRVHAIIAFLVVLLLIVVNIVFDILGTSVTAAELPPFNAMASKRRCRVRGSAWLVRNPDTVANFCNDVVGDVAGAVTGATGATVALRLSLVMQGQKAGRSRF